MVDHQQPLAGGARLASHWPNADAAHWRLSRPRCSGGSLRSPGQRETSRRSGGGGRPPVLEGDDKDDVVWLLVAVDDQHPPPRPRMNRNGLQRPSSCRPIRGNCSRTRSERLTRSLVSGGRLCVRIMRSRSLTAAVLSLTSANVQKDRESVESGQ